MPRNSIVKNDRFSKSKLALAIAAHMLVSGNVLAAPAGGEVVGGSGSIEQQGTETTITQNTDRLAIDWQNFDIGANERVEFVQPGQSAVALNRILGNKGSEILGRIDANGHVILVNPRGVVFGEGAVINAGGLIASGLQINPEDFMNGNLVFKRIEGTDGTVINSGMINAAAGGNVTLLGAQVENRGLISANLGSVILASGKEAVLTFDESGLLGVRVDEAILQDELGSSAAVANSGEIRAENGRILLSASTTRDVFSQAVNWGDQKHARSVTYNEDGSFTLGAGGNVENSGTLDVSGVESAGVVVALAENVTHTGSINAGAVQGQGGHVELLSNITTLVAEEGVVTASGAEGGVIKLLGKNVGLLDRAVVEAVGQNGGGRILLGGDQEGLNSRIRNAKFVYVGEKTSIDASATDAGDGGIAIVFAEDTTRIYGSLLAKGGENGGNGGFVETSGKMGFEIMGSPEVSAAKGRAGHWLIDPSNLVIDQAGTRSIDDETQANHFISEASNARLDTEDLQEALNAGATITVKTGSATGGQGNITVSSDITLGANVTSTLNLIAHNNISINANITTGDKTANRKLNVQLNANTSGNQGSITFGNNVRIETDGGNFVVGGIDANGEVDSSVAGAYNVDFSNLTIDVTGPSYESLGTFNTYFGNRNPAAAQSDRQYLSDSGRILVNASNNVNLGGSNGTGDGNGSVTMNVRGREREENLEKIHIIAGNDILLSDGRVWTYDNNPTEVLESGQSPYDGFTTLKLEAGGDIDLDGDIIYAWDQATGDNRQEQNDRLMIDLSAGGDLSIDGDVDTAGGHFIVRDAVDVDFSGQTINTSSRYGAGNVSITATGDITLGALPMFGQSVDAGSLRNPSLTAIAGDTLNIGNSDFYTRGGSIELGAAQWNFSGRRLETRNGGDIIFTTAGALTLPTVISSRNVTINSKNADDALTVTGAPGGLELNGLLTLDLKSASANIGNITNSSTAAAANLVITSAQDLTLQMNEAIRLGDSAVSGDLTLASDAGIVQSGTRLTVEGASAFNVNNSSVTLNQEANVFTGAVWMGGTNAQNADLYSAQDLILGGDETMALAGTLSARAGGNLGQVGAIAITGATTVSAGGNITLDAANRFSSLAIAGAESAVIRNNQNLSLGAAQNLASLDLSVAGNLSQSAALNLNELILAVTGVTTLAQNTNSIANLSGSAASGEIATTGSLLLGDFAITGDQTFTLRLNGNNAQVSQVADTTFTTASNTIVSAAQVEINSEIELQNGADLTFENVVDFILRGDVQGVDSEDNAVTINGTTGNGNYEIHADAAWADVSLVLSGGTGADTLRGPDLASTWRIQAAEPHTLETAQGKAQFRGMEALQGGNQVDNFAFATGAVTTLALSGGAGADVADYSGMTGNITVPLGAGAGLSSVERIRGNNDGTGTTNSALVAQGNTANSWTINAVNAGQVTPAGGTVMVFEGFNQLQGGGGQDHFTFNANLTGGSAQADGAGGDDIFDVLAEITTNLIGGEGEDRFNLGATTVGGLAGGGGNDTFVLTEDARVASLDGGTGLNTLLGLDTDLFWSIDTTPIFGGAVRVQVADAVGTVYVEGARNLTGLQGGTANDTFLFGLNNSGIGADGGGGTNTADFSAVVGNLTVNLGELNLLGVSKVSQVVGNAQAETTATVAVVGNGASEWNFLSAGGGTVQLGANAAIVFSGFNDFIGGDGADIFTLRAAPGGQVSGGGGNDRFVLMAAEIGAQLKGDAGNDTLRAQQDMANVWTLRESGSHLQREGSLTPGLIQESVAFNGMETLEGAANFDDTFTIGERLTAQPTIIAGNGPAAVDTIDHSLLTSTADPATWLSVTLGSAGLTGFERVIGNGATATLKGADAASNWTLSADGGQVQWTQNSNTQTTAFRGFGHWVGGSQNDEFILQTSSDAPSSISGGNGTDRLDMSAITTAVTVTVGPGATDGVEYLVANPLIANQLTSNTELSDWAISSRNGGTLTQDGSSRALNFSGFWHLQGLGSNNFAVVEAGALGQGAEVGSLRGGTGNDFENILVMNSSAAHSWTLTGAGAGRLANAQTAVLDFAGMTELTAGAGQDSFILGDAAATISRINAGDGDDLLRASFDGNGPLLWSVTDDVGSIANHVGEFVGIDSLRGHDGIDEFAITGTSNLAMIDGGGQPDAGADHLDLSGYGSALVWRLAEQRIGNFRYTDIERISAPANQQNTLQAPDSINTWTITGANSGSFSIDGGISYAFSGVSQLLGGSLEDLFVLAGGSVSGNLDGGGGTNRLQGNNAANQWTLSGADSGVLTSTAGGVAAFQRIQNLLGGSGTDRFVIQTGGALSGGLDGGAGAAVDTLESTRAAQTWTLASTASSGLANRDGTAALLFTGVEALVGAGQDHLVGDDQDRNWRVTATGAGDFNSVGEDSIITFSGFNVLLGGAGADVFDVGPTGWMADRLDGGGGNNSLLIRSEAAVSVNLDGALRPEQSLTALRLQTIEVDNDSANSLLGVSTAEGGYSWTVDAINSGTVAPTLNPTEGSAVRFINFARLVGGEHSDLFRIASGGLLMAGGGGGGVDGGEGVDFLDYSAREGNLDITVGGNLGQGENFRIDSIEGLVGNQDGSGDSDWRATLRAADGTNIWTLRAGEDVTQDGINDGVFVSSDPNVLPMAFRNFSHLEGGSGADTFVLSGQGMLTGGISDAGGANDLDLRNLASGRTLKVTLYTQEPAARQSDTLLIRGIQTLQGAALATTLVGADTGNQWQINSNNSGQLVYGTNTVTFSDFGHLQGGALIDVFTFGPAGQLAGWLAGGAGEDRVVFNNQQPVSVWLADAAPAGPTDGQNWHSLRRDIESLTTGASGPNHLQLESEDAAEWRITGANQGALDGLVFSGFGRITGGAGNDSFTFAQSGSLSNLLDGGRGENTLDLRTLTTPVTVSEGRRRDGVDLGITRIQAVQANPLNPANRLWADDRDNRWSVEGQNSGTLTGDTSRLSFSGFGNLSGGSLDDRFEFVAAGDISGQLDGGGHTSGDTVDYTAHTAALVIDLRGQSRLRNIETLIGNQHTTLMGPDQNAEWQVTGLDAGQLVYGADLETQLLNFSGVGRLAGGQDRDEFIFSGGALSGGADSGAGDDRFVYFLQAGSANRLTRLDGGAGLDSLEVRGGGNTWSGVYSLDAMDQPRLVFQTLDTAAEGSSLSYAGLESALVTAELAGMRLQASLATQVVQLAGQSWQLDEQLPVVYRSGVTGLAVETGAESRIHFSGAVNLPGSLSLQGGMVTVEAGASITAAELSLLAVAGVGAADAPLDLSISRLQLSGGTGQVFLREADGLELTGLEGGEGLDLVVFAGDLSQSGAITTDAALNFAALGGSVQLGHLDNQISGTVALQAAADAVLLNNLDTQLGPVRTRNLQVDSAGGIQSDVALAVTDTTRLSSGGDLVLTHADNDLHQVLLTSAGGASIVNSDTLVLAGAEVVGHLDLYAGNLRITGEVSAVGDINLDTAGQVLMEDQGQITSTEGDIALVSAGTQALRLLAANEGEVRLTSGAAIVDANDTASAGLNIQAQRFHARAVSGIGSSNPLELEVEYLDVVNQRDSVELSNSGPLTVERLHNGGHIILSNTTDVTVLKESVNAFYGTEQAQYPENKANPGIGHSFFLRLAAGSIKTDGSLVLNQPHIAANSVTIFDPLGVFLPPSPVIYAPLEVFITIGRSRSRPPWGFGVKPAKVTDDTSYYGDVVGAGEQLIEVETLADIDPAIFTQVKNYFYQEVSVRLPSDQLYEEE
jgi:filamentous hemagglutinin family protein